MHDHLDYVVKSVSRRDFFIVGGELNAKTWSSLSKDQQNYWKYIKVTANVNGFELNFCMRMYLVLMNTYLKHQKTHRTTCQFPDIASAIHRDDTSRKNLVRNQIEYIIVKRYGLWRTRSEDNMYPGQLIPKTTRAQDYPCPRRILRKTARIQKSDQI